MTTLLAFVTVAAWGTWIPLAPPQAAQVLAGILIAGVGGCIIGAMR